MHTFKLVVRPAVIAAFMAVTAAGIVKVAAADAGSCGQYMYWQGGKCVDARDKSAKSWSDNMASKLAW